MFDLSVVLKVLSAVLVLSEAMAAIQTLLFPDNKGVGGVLAGIIRLLKGMGVSDQAPPAPPAP